MSDLLFLHICKLRNTSCQFSLISHFLNCDEFSYILCLFGYKQDDETKVASLKKDVSLFVEMVAKHQTRLISAKQSLDQSRQISGDDSEIELKFQVMQVAKTRI